MEIQQALDWNKVGLVLKKELKTIGFNPDLDKMLHNINVMVDDLSKNEVTYRRLNKYPKEKIANINNAINRLEKLILIAKLTI